VQPSKRFEKGTISDHQMKVSLFEVLQKISLATISQSQTPHAPLRHSRSLGIASPRHVVLDPNVVMIIAPYFCPAAAGKVTISTSLPALQAVSAHSTRCF
jgi:hypothetical protein